LTQAIKSYPIEKKAHRNFSDCIDDIPVRKLRVTQTPNKGQKLMLKTTAGSFYKTTARRTSDMQNENDASMGNKSGEKGDQLPVEGTHQPKIAMLRRKYTEQEGQLPKDISKLISKVESIGITS
jgi:hypothetical protein